MRDRERLNGGLALVDQFENRDFVLDPDHRDECDLFKEGTDLHSADILQGESAAHRTPNPAAGVHGAIEVIFQRLAWEMPTACFVSSPQTIRKRIFGFASE